MANKEKVRQPKFESVFVSGVCLGVGYRVGSPGLGESYHMICNTLLGETPADAKESKANAELISLALNNLSRR